MNETQLEGMRARAEGAGRESNPHSDEQRQRHWAIGFDLMDEQIHQLLDKAQQMLDGLRRARHNAVGNDRKYHGQIQRQELPGDSPQKLRLAASFQE